MKVRIWLWKDKRENLIKAWVLTFSTLLNINHAALAIFYGLLLLTYINFGFFSIVTGILAAHMYINVLFFQMGT